jgi:hypothetical protein
VTVGAFPLAWLNSAGLKQIGVQFDQFFGTDGQRPAAIQLHHPGLAAGADDAVPSRRPDTREPPRH